MLNIVKHLVKSNKKGYCNSSVVLTTHSPYILSVLNVLMAEAKLYVKHTETTYIEGVDDFVNYDCFMLPKYYSAYYINDKGTFENLIDSKLPMISGLELDNVSDWVEKRISQTNKLMYG